MKIPAFTIEAPGFNQQVVGVEFQPIDPAAYQLEAGWLCLAEIDGGEHDFFVGAPYGGRCTIQRYERGEWKDIPGALITCAEWEEV